MKTRSELRKFGLVLGPTLGAIAVFLLWRGSTIVGPVLLGLATFLLVGGLLHPSLLRPVERAWMALAERIGVVMTYVILGLTFYLVITPLSLLLRLLGKDLLQISEAEKRDSYWVPLDKNGAAVRFEEPY